MAAMHGLLGWLARWVAAHPRAVLLGGLLVGVLAGTIGLPPQINSGSLHLFPSDEPVAAALTEVSGQAGGVAGIYLVFEGDDPERMGAALDDLAERLGALERVRFALHRLPPPLALHVGLLQLDPDVMAQLATRLEQAIGLGPALNPFLAARLLDMPEATAQLEAAGGSALWFPDDGLGRIFVKPFRTHHDAQNTRDVVHDVQGVVADAKPLLDEAGVRLQIVTGPYATFAAGLDGVADDIVLTTAISVVLVLLVLAIGLRSITAPLVVLPPLVVAAAINFAFLAVTFGAINTYTSIGSALLFGLGIDVAVHLLSRYREARARGATAGDALAEAWDRAGPPCITAGLTSVAGFLAMGLFRFHGLSQLGYSLALGLVASLVAVLVLLPALIVLLDREPRAPMIGATPASDAPGSPRTMAGVGLLLALLATVGASVFALPQLRFNHDFTAIGRDDLTFSLLDEAGKQHMRDALAPVVVTLGDPHDLPAEHARLEALVEGGAMPLVRSVLSLETLLPHDQARRVAVLERLRAVAHDARARYLPPTVQRQLSVLRDWDPRVRTSSELPEGLSTFLLDGRRILLLAQGDLYDVRESTKLLEQLRPHVDRPASDQLLQAELLRIVFEDLPWVLGVAWLAVALFTAADLRRFWPVAGVLGSLAAGLVWAGSLAGLVGLQLNLGNIVALPILLGIGIDVVVHLTHRLQHERRVIVAYRTVGVAAVVSTLTTVASFVALTSSSSGGVRSLGQLVVLGLPTVTVVSAMVLALGWRALRPPAP